MYTEQKELTSVAAESPHGNPTQCFRLKNNKNPQKPPSSKKLFENSCFIYDLTFYCNVCFNPLAGEL